MVNKYKFFNRYATRGISSKLPLELQGYLWSLISDLMIKNDDIDFLQIFELKQLNDTTLEISHKQEQPEYKETHKLNINGYDLTGIDASKIYVIDDLTHATMLFSEEY